MTCRDMGWGEPNSAGHAPYARRDRGAGALELAQGQAEGWRGSQETPVCSPPSEVPSQPLTRTLKGVPRAGPGAVAFAGTGCVQAGQAAGHPAPAPTACAGGPGWPRRPRGSCHVCEASL